MRDWPIEIEPRYPRAVFLDRDGTLTVDGGYDPAQLRFADSVLDGLRQLAELPLMLIVVSNQAKIGLGKISFATMMRYNFALRCQAEQAGGRIDGFYFCPHPRDPETDVPCCRCAKPQPTMLLDAAEDFRLDLAGSYLIGDGFADIRAGNAAGTTTIALGLSEPNEAALTVTSFAEAADWIAARLDN